MPASSAFADLMPTSGARDRHHDNYVKPFRILDIYSADGKRDIYRIMFCRQNLNHDNINESVWMRYEGKIRPNDAVDDLHENLDSFFMEPLVEKQPFTITTLYSWKGEKGFDPFWSIVLEYLQKEWTPEVRDLIRAVQVHASAFHDDDIESFNHGTSAANWVKHLDQLQVMGVTYWAQLAGAETKARRAAIRFGGQVVTDSDLLLVVEGEAATFESDYKYSVKTAMMRMVGSVELIGVLISGEVNKDGLKVLNNRFGYETAQTDEEILDDRSETVRGDDADSKIDEA